MLRMEKNIRINTDRSSVFTRIKMIDRIDQGLNILMIVFIGQKKAGHYHPDLLKDATIMLMGKGRIIFQSDHA